MSKPSETTPPTILPIFPLSGFLLLPGAHAPLHIFESRYRNLIRDALAGDRCFGMVQPQRVEESDEDDELDAAGPDAAEGGTAAPEVYSVGCAARIDFAEQLGDGRYLILVRGLRRFRIVRELPLRSGYRRVEAEYEEFEVDRLDAEAEIDAAPILTALETFSRAHRLALEVEKLGELPGRSLLNCVAMALPFAPAEKQALLEAPDLRRRQEALLALMTMGIELGGDSPVATAAN